MRFPKANHHVSVLSQSILAKAYRGELVRTEAELAKEQRRKFESAEQLLERVRERLGGEFPSKAPAEDYEKIRPCACRENLKNLHRLQNRLDDFGQSSENAAST